MPKASNEVKKWLAIAKEDMEVAKELFKNGRYLYATFFCQQVLEKSFKAIIEKKLKKEPPFIHNLVRLAELADYPMDDTATGYFEDLNLHYIKSRYIAERDKLPGNKKAFASRMIIVAEGILSWSLKKSK
jgi:HEPN domain-containing protein